MAAATSWTEAGVVGVAAGAADLGGDVLRVVVEGVERVDLFETEGAAAGEGGVKLAVAEGALEVGDHRGPGPGADGRAGLGESLRDRPAVPVVVRDPRDERALPPEVDGEHGSLLQTHNETILVSLWATEKHKLAGDPGNGLRSQVIPMGHASGLSKPANPLPASNVSGFDNSANPASRETCFRCITQPTAPDHPEPRGYSAFSSAARAFQ
jgi:hypothetical protein